MNNETKVKVTGSILFFTGLIVMHLGFAYHEELFVFIGALFWIGAGTKLHHVKNNEPPNI